MRIITILFTVLLVSSCASSPAQKQDEVDKKPSATASVTPTPTETTTPTPSVTAPTPTETTPPPAEELVTAVPKETPAPATPEPPAPPVAEKPKVEAPAKPVVEEAPAPPPAPAYTVEEASGTLYVVTSANVRSGPGTGYGRVGGVTAGTAINVDGKSNGWYRFEGSKWIAGSLVASEKPAPPPPAPSKGTTTNPPASSGGADNILWVDNVAGELVNHKSVPCGGLWSYTSPNFYAREINCAGSARYLTIQVGQKIKIGNRVCRMVGAQNLNYLQHDMGDVNWMGNVIVQTCWSNRDRGSVRLVNFSCE